MVRYHLLGFGSTVEKCGQQTFACHYDTEREKQPGSGFPLGTVISTGTLAWNAPGTNGNANLQPIRTRTEASSTISVDTSYASPATYATPSATYDVITTIGSGSNTVYNLS